MSDPDVFDPGGAFRSAVRDSLSADPHPTFERLAANLGIPVDEVIHFALYRWASAGAEALMSTRPQLLRELDAAAERGDLTAVRGLVAMILAGLDSDLR